MKSPPPSSEDTARKPPVTASEGVEGPASAVDVDAEMFDVAALALETCQVPWAAVIKSRSSSRRAAMSSGSTASNDRTA